MVIYGTTDNLWEPMRTVDNLWELVRATEKIWEPMRTTEKLMGTYENLWEPHENQWGYTLDNYLSGTVNHWGPEN